MDNAQRLLVPTDFSDASEHALRYALELATRLEAKVDLLHVYLVPTFPDRVLALPALERILRSSEEALARVASKCDPSVLGELLLKAGDAREVIAEMADELDTDLIVMVTHGRPSAARSALGSVTEAVLRSAPCPVLAVSSPKLPSAAHITSDPRQSAAHS